MNSRLASPGLLVFALLAGLAAAAPVMAAPADVPNPPLSSVDPVLVGTPSGAAILCAGTAGPGFNVVVRDFLGNPIPGSMVTLNFLFATGPRAFAMQNAGTTVSCVGRTISRVTDAAGRTVFAARFGGYTNAADVEVSADGVVIDLVPARSPDVLGTGNRADLPDFAAFSAAYQCTTCPQFDFDNSGGEIGLNDLAIFSREYLLMPPGVPYCW